jgi:hypothetical protein
MSDKTQAAPKGWRSFQIAPAGLLTHTRSDALFPASTLHVPAGRRRRAGAAPLPSALRLGSGDAAQSASPAPPRAPRLAERSCNTERCSCPDDEGGVTRPSRWQTAQEALPYSTCEAVIGGRCRSAPDYADRDTRQRRHDGSTQAAPDLAGRAGSTGGSARPPNVARSTICTAPGSPSQISTTRSTRCGGSNASSAVRAWPT